MSTTSKNPKTLLASSLTKLVSNHATRAQPAEKTSGTCRHTRKGNSELETAPDQHNVLSDETVTAEDYTLTNLIENHVYQNIYFLTSKLNHNVFFEKFHKINKYIC